MTKRKILLVSLFAVIILLFIFFIAEIVKAPYNVEIRANINWNKSSINTDKPVISLAQNSKDKNIVYAVTQNAFYVSDDSGNSFEKVFSVSPNVWKNMPDILFYRVNFSPLSDTVYFALRGKEEDSVFSYDCKNKTVKKVFETKFPVTDIENGPNNGSVLFATYGGGIYRVGNSDRVKAGQIVKFKDISRFYFTSVACLQDGRMIAGFDGNPKNAPLPLVISNKNGNFDWEYIYAKITDADNILFNVNSVYCIRPAEDGIYISTSSSSAPLLFTNDGTNFSVVKRIRKVFFPQSGIRYIQPVEKYEGIFFSEDFVDDSKGYPNISSNGVCFIRPDGKSPVVCLGPSNENKEDFSPKGITTFLVLSSKNIIIAAKGNKVYYAHFTKEFLLSGGV